MDKQVAEENRQRKGRARPQVFVEGDLFTSLFEGATSYAIKSCASRERSGACAVDLKYVDARDASATTWNDRVFLVESRGRWVVDDIE